MTKHYYGSKAKAQAAADESTRMDGIARKVIEHHGFFIAVVAA